MCFGISDHETEMCPAFLGHTSRKRQIPEKVDQKQRVVIVSKRWPKWTDMSTVIVIETCVEAKRET